MDVPSISVFRCTFCQQAFLSRTLLDSHKPSCSVSAKREAIYGDEKKRLTGEISSLSILAQDVVPLVVEYATHLRVDESSLETWSTGHRKPYGIISDSKKIYVRSATSGQSVLTYSVEGKLVVGKFPSLEGVNGFAIDLYDNKFYISDSPDANLFIFSQTKELLLNWKLPKPKCWAIKVDNDKIYTTFAYCHQIFVLNQSGQPITTIGKETKSEKEGEFNESRGITIVNDNLYVCDCNNNRIQVLDKETGKYRFGWGSQGTAEGQFCLPYAIHLSDDTLYVGDFMNVQLFSTYGIFVQKIGEATYGKNDGQFNFVTGLAVVNERLYVSDNCNGRIKVYNFLK